ncbi:hypothetical protein SLEP1_g30430 [Rubroshorea leprosula]|uniref:Uncharacterized protein n=1 Tax=Rubroshorea leprosula TaxID=152421 RepID=A0AAV5K2F9_9ROSI|nr:hypothetical protein SLEP1_g30430 [Rubroshorea leprosula]
MAESKKETLAVNPKKKSLLLDDEIGKDFLSSWKSMSVTEDSAMDFSFDEIPMGKKKPFNFEKLDMDFNLDGDLDKLSSFKIDLPDLDFSSPSAKSEEKSKEETSSGNNQGKKQHFAFSFDFNELDDFNFSSSLMGREKACKKRVDSETVTLDGTNSEGSKISPAFKDNSITAKFLAPEDAANSKVKMDELEDSANMKVKMADVGPGAQNSADEACLSKTAASVNFVESHESRISPEKIVSANVKETDQSITVPDRSPRTVSSQPCNQHSVQNSPISSVPEKILTRDHISDKQAEVYSLGTKSNAISAEEQNVHEKTMAVSGSNQAKVQQQSSSQVSYTGKGQKEGGDINMPSEIKDGAASGQGNVDLKNISAGSPSTEIMHDSGANKNVQNSTPKHCSVLLDSELAVNKLKAKKDTDAGAIRSRFFTRSEETDSQSHQPLPTGEKVFSFSSRRVSAMQVCPANEKREDVNATEAQTERKLLGNSKSISRGLAIDRPALPESKNKVNGDTREGLSDDALENERLCSSRLQDKLVPKGEAVLMRSERNARFQANPSSSREKETGSSILTSLNLVPPVLKVEESVRNSKVVSEGLKAAKRTPDLSSLKISRNRTGGANKVPSNVTLPRDTNSSISTDESRELPAKTTTKITHPGTVGNIEKQTPLIPSLKRKTFEESNVGLMPLKTLKGPCESPSGSRNFRESSQMVAEKEVFNHVNPVEVVTTTNILNDYQMPGSEVPHEVNMAELEIASVKEDNGNVEKAEAYTKELENICNILKKKHDEAKELLVRAVVNNNNLLMLNHPIFEEKISFHLSLL